MGYLKQKNRWVIIQAELDECQSSC